MKASASAAASGPGAGTGPVPIVLRHRPGTARRPVLFLDRDGVLIENRDHYVRSLDDVEVLPGALAAVRRLSEHRDVVLVSNQSVVGRGLVPAERILSTHQAVVDLFVRHGGAVLGSVLCTHAPSDDCPCRKPLPGMLRTAAHTWAIDPATCWMVGDARTDVQAATAAGCRPLLVRTGRGRDQEGPTLSLLPDCVVADSLHAAVETLLIDPFEPPTEQGEHRG